MCNTIPNEGFIYRIACQPNGRSYYGQCSAAIHRNRCPIRHRFAKHRYALRHAKPANPNLQADWNKYGEQAFQFEVMERGIWERDYLDFLEKCYIKSAEGRAYNLIAGGSRGYSMAAESNERNSQSQLGALGHFFGKKHTDEAREKMRIAAQARVKRQAEARL